MDEQKIEKIGILGYGEVGQAIAKLYKEPRFCEHFKVLIKDLERNDGLEGADILNICIPFSDNFIEIVRNELVKIKPKLAIIHSTVGPGITKQIADVFSDINVVHSPVRGVHPYLYEGIKTFVKYIGADKEESGRIAQEHLEGLGIKTKIFMPSRTTELGKLFGTTYYGLCIAYHGEMKKICAQERIDFDKAVTDFNQTYNQGYKELGKENVVRPVLYPPEGHIGGHCVGNNVEILKKYYQSAAFDLIDEYKKNKIQEK